MARRPRKATPTSLENAALHYLERFASSAENLRRVLMRRVERSAREHGTDRAEGAAAVDALVRRFVDSGLLDDRTYAEGRVASLRRRGDGARKIRGKLLQKGVDPDLVDDLLAEEEPAADLAAALVLARRRRLGPYRRPEERPERRDKDLAALARAGFPPEVALRVVDAADPEQLEAETGDR